MEGEYPVARWASSRQRTGYRLVAFICALAATVVILDNIIESGSLLSWTRTSSVPVPDSDDHVDLSKPEKETTLETRWTTLPVDHNDPSGPSFQNRYWINDRYFRPGGPVFVYDSGEGDAIGSVERFLERPTSFTGQLMQEFHGLGILWEHRYYGESLPFPVNEKTTAEHFRYLTLNQSLADLPYFAHRIHLESFPDADLRPSSVPWVMLGCSYSGTRAALSRLVHPETFYAAFAGEAVVLFNATVNQYHKPLYESLDDHGYQNCSKDLHSISKYMDQQLDSTETASRLKQLFFGRGAENFTNHDFASAFDTLFMYFKTWGITDGKPSVASLCDRLEWDIATNQPAGAEGLTASRGSDYLSQRVASWPEFLKHINEFFNTSCQIDSLTQDTCNLTYPYRGDSWLWQQCSELGFIVATSGGPYSLGSRYAGVSVSDCQRFFPGQPQDELSDLIARVSPTNRHYGGLQMRPSNVFWSGGQYDPWRSLTPLASDQIDAGPHSVHVTQEIPACGVSTGNEAIFGQVLPEAGHCAVIGKNTTQVHEARRLFADALKEWFRCF